MRTRIFAPGQPMVEQIDFFNFLFPGNTFTGGGTVATTHPGEAQIEVRVDPQGLLQEGDVTNNQGLAVITIYDSAESCLPCTTGAPLDTVGSLLCLADPDTGMPADGSVWQCQGVRADGTSCVASGNHPNGWGYQGPRCPDPATLPAGLHPDACGIADICPGTGP